MVTPLISEGHKLQQLSNKSGAQSVESHFLFAEINRCVVNNGGCHQNATCTVDITMPGFRSCLCNRDFTGDGLFCAGKYNLQSLLPVIRRCLLSSVFSSLAYDFVQREHHVRSKLSSNS